MVRVDGLVGLLFDGSMLPWSFDGYGGGSAPPAAGSVDVLTPPATVGAIAAGYRPAIHPSAGSAG